MYSFEIHTFQNGFEKCTFQIGLKKWLVFFLFGTLFKLGLKSALVQGRNAEKANVERTHYEGKHVKKTKTSLITFTFFYLSTRFDTQDRRCGVYNLTPPPPLSHMLRGRMLRKHMLGKHMWRGHKLRRHMLRGRMLGEHMRRRHMRRGHMLS